MMRQAKLSATASITMLFLLLLAASPAQSAFNPPAADDFFGARTVSGRVYLDRGDAGTEPLAGVRVFAGREVAVTDDAGGYAIESDKPFLAVWVQFPDGTFPSNPWSWFQRMRHEQATGVDFRLRADAPEEKYPFLLIHFSDSHGYFEESIPQMLQESERLPLAPEFFICTGDMSRFPQLHEMIAHFERPVFFTPGNTDASGLRGWPPRAGHLEEVIVNHPSFPFLPFERFINPKRWSFVFRGVCFIGVEWSANWIENEGDGNLQRERLRQDTMNWVERELKERPAGTRPILCKHDHSGFLRTMLQAHPDITFALQGGSHAYHPLSANYVGYQHADRIREGGTLQPRTGRGHGRSNPPGYNLVVVEEDRIDTFYRPLGLPNDHAILVNHPLRARGNIRAVRDDVETPVEIQVFGQVLDLAGAGVGQVMVRAGDEAVEARTERRRYWVDYEATLTLHRAQDYIEALTISAAFPDGTYALVNPFQELNWAVQRVEP